MRCGVVDSIRTCLENRDEMNDKMLKLLVQSFERIKKPTQTTHTSTTRNRKKITSHHAHKICKNKKKTRQIMKSSFKKKTVIDLAKYKFNK
jgi:hypothetical protein